MWTKTFKSSTTAEDDVEEVDVEMTVEGGASSERDPAEYDVFEKQMCLNKEVTVEPKVCQVFSPGKQHDTLKKRTIDKTLKSTMKALINTTLPTCDDKGVFTDNDDTYRKHKKSTVSEGW